MNMKQKHLILLCSLLLLSVFSLGAQEKERKADSLPKQWNIKSNLLYDLTGTVNLGAEFQLNERWTIDISGNYNGWNWRNNRKWKHWMLQPEARLWTRRAMEGHFFALHALGGEYNLGKVHLPFGLFKKLRTLRHEGWYLGAGIGYGYRWNLSPRWGIEAEAALGYIHFDYRNYECATCGERLGTGKCNYIGPTKLAFILIYRFGK